MPPPKGYLAMSADISVGHDLGQGEQGMMSASSGHRPGIFLNVPQMLRTCPTEKNYWL